MKKCIFCMANSLLFLGCAFAQDGLRQFKIINNQTAMLSTNSLIARDIVGVKFITSYKSTNNL